MLGDNIFKRSEKYFYFKQKQVPDNDFNLIL